MLHKRCEEERNYLANKNVVTLSVDIRVVRKKNARVDSGLVSDFLTEVAGLDDCGVCAVLTDYPQAQNLDYSVSINSHGRGVSIPLPQTD